MKLGRKKVTVYLEGDSVEQIMDALIELGNKFEITTMMWNDELTYNQMEILTRDKKES